MLESKGKVFMGMLDQFEDMLQEDRKGSDLIRRSIIARDKAFYGADCANSSVLETDEEKRDDSKAEVKRGSSKLVTKKLQLLGRKKVTCEEKLQTLETKSEELQTTILKLIESLFDPSDFNKALTKQIYDETLHHYALGESQKKVEQLFCDKCNSPKADQISE